jgi:hypothetical protein
MTTIIKKDELPRGDYGEIEVYFLGEREEDVWLHIGGKATWNKNFLTISFNDGKITQYPMMFVSRILVKSHHEEDKEKVWEVVFAGDIPQQFRPAISKMTVFTGEEGYEDHPRIFR